MRLKKHFFQRHLLSQIVATALAIVGAAMAAKSISAADLFATGFSSHAIHKFSSSGASLGSIGSGGTYPAALGFDSRGFLYVANSENLAGDDITTICKFSPQGANLGVIIEFAFNSQYSLTVGPDDNLYLAHNGEIRRFRSDGFDLGVFASTTAVNTIGMTFDAAGYLYVSDRPFPVRRILQISPTGQNLGVFATVTGDAGPNGLAFDRDGNLYVSYYGADRIEKFSPSGADLGAFATTGLNHPEGIVFDDAGNLYVANGGADYAPAPYMNSIHRFGPAGQDLGTFATLPFGANPQWLAFAPTIVPEPASAALAFVGLAWLHWRTSRRSHAAMP